MQHGNGRVEIEQMHQNPQILPACGAQIRIFRQYGARLGMGFFDQMPVRENIGKSVFWKPALARAESVSRAAQLQIQFGNFKTVIAFSQLNEALTLNIG